jgi:acyl-CoA synthetase (AMP-forming)/AMP-acid ligase II
VEIPGKTLVDLLRGKAIRQPDRLGYSFLPKGEAEEARFTYAELDLRARAISAWLSSVSAAGDRVLLLSSSGPEFVSAVFGCLYRGAVAVPAYPLDPARISRTVSRLQRILKDAEPVVALTTGNTLGFVEDLVPTHCRELGSRSLGRPANFLNSLTTRRLLSDRLWLAAQRPLWLAWSWHRASVDGWPC